MKNKVLIFLTGSLLSGAVVNMVDSYMLKPHTPPAPITDKRIHISNSKGVEIGAVDPTTNKFELFKGQKCEDAVVECVNFARTQSAYHDRFKADILASATPEMRKKLEPPTKK